MFRQQLSHFNSLMSALMDGEAFATVMGSVLLVLTWLATSQAIGAGIIAAIPPVIPLTSVPSIDCLMQQAHCFP